MNRTAMRTVVLGAGILLPLAAGAQMTPDPTGSGMMNPASPTPGAMASGATPGGTSPGIAPVTPANTSMRDSLGAPGLTGRQMRDQQFLRKATADGIAEVQFAKLAEEKGSPEVKQFAQKMLEDHTALNNEMGNVADQLGVIVPKKMSKQDEEEYKRLSGLSGDDFDREYIALMLKDHREDLHQFRMEAMNAADQNLATEVTNAARTIREHMHLATRLAEQKGVPVPPRTQHPNGPPSGI